MGSTKYTREMLEPIVKSSGSLAEVMRKLGLKVTGGNYRYISLRIRRSELDTSHFFGKISAQVKAIPEGKLEDLVRRCTSFAQVLLELGLPVEGRPHRDMTARVRSLGLDTSHFTGPGWSRGQTWRTNDSLARGRRKLRIRDEDVFIENSPISAGPLLTPRLLALGWSYECAWCGISEWRGTKLVLHLDHTNGIHNDNRLENLRLLCPNCHSQTATYSNRRRH